MHGHVGTAGSVAGRGRGVPDASVAAAGPAARTGVPVRSGRGRSAGARRPAPAGPGRPAVRGRRPVVRPVPGGRPGAGRPVAGRARPAVVVPRPPARARGALLAVALAVAAAVVVAGMGLLADLVAAAAVPEATAPVVVRQDESLWQVARRVAPSAEPSAVVDRIVELNGLVSPSVEGGRTVLSPIG